jgi:hypothetical protein
MRTLPLISSTLALSGALLLAPTPAQAGDGDDGSRAPSPGAPDDRDRALPCRPTIACTADLVPPGTFEIEAGYLYRAAAGGATQRTFPVLLKLTLTPWLQLQVGSNGYTVAQGDVPARFLDDVVLGLKLHLADQVGARPALALSAAVSVPTPAGQEGYLRTYDALFTAYASKDVGPIHADLNVGMNLWRLEDHPLPQAFAALAFSADLVAPFGVMAEGYAFSSAAPVAARDGGFLFAFTHAPRRWLMFDLGGDVGLFRATRAYSVFVGLTVIPAVLWR